MSFDLKSKMDSENEHFTEIQPISKRSLKKEPIVLDTNSLSPETILPDDDDDVDINKLYEKNKNFLDSFTNDGSESINTENMDFKANEIYRENAQFVNSQTYIERDFPENIPSREFVEMNEKVDSYMLENRLFEKVYNNKISLFDTKSMMSVDTMTENASIKEYMECEASKRHYYMLIQKNNTLLNDAKQFREKLVEKIAFTESKLKELEEAKNETSKQNFLKRRYYTYRKGYFTDEDLYVAPPNNDAKKIARMDIASAHVTQAVRWTPLHMDRLKKELSKHIMQNKSEELKVLKNKLVLTKHSKTANVATQYATLAQQLEYLKSLPDNQIPLQQCVKSVSIDWQFIATRIRPEPNAELQPQAQSGDDCRRMWGLCLAPHINQKPWTKEEDKKLDKLAKRNNCQNWDNAAKTMETKRTGFQAFTHYQLKHPKDSNIPWSKKEDIILLEAISKYRHSPLKQMSLNSVFLRFPRRSKVEIKNRLMYLKNSTLGKSNIKKGSFSDWEVRVMETCIKQGLDFKTIAQLLGNRTVPQVRDKMSRKYSRHVSLQEKRKGLFTAEEDSRLMSLTVKYGIKSWAFLARKMKTRDRTQCRHRYNNIITHIKKGTEFSSKKMKLAGEDKKGALKEEKTETFEKMMELLDDKRLTEIYVEQKERQKRRPKPNAYGYTYVRKPLPYQRKFQNSTRADAMIHQYFSYAQPIQRCTQLAVKPDVMNKYFTGDALLAMLHYLEMKADLDLLTSFDSSKATDIHELWNTADYAYMTDWYKNKVDELNEIKALNLDHAGREGICEDIDLELPHFNFNNRHSIHSMLDCDIGFYKSNLVHAPILSRAIHTRLVINKNGATTSNDIDNYQEVNEYFFPPSKVTLKALRMYEKFQTETLVQNETIHDNFNHEYTNVKDAAEGNAAKKLLESRLKSLLTASCLLTANNC